MNPLHPFWSGPYPRAFAHRGWHLGATAGLENSLPAFRTAVGEGYRYLETDVHATRDGVVVVAHDADLDRTTDMSGAIKDLPWQTVRRARIGGTVEVCTLAELLEELPEAYLNIDVKADEAVEPVLDVLDAANAYDRVCLASFSDERLRRLRARAGEKLLTSMGPRAVAALLASAWIPGGWFDGAITGLAAQIPPRHGPVPVVTRPLLRAARRRGIEVHVWTVDGAEQMAQLLDLGVDGIVTDAPHVLRAVLRAHDRWPASTP